MGGPSRHVLLADARGFTGVHLRRAVEAACNTVIRLTNGTPVGTNECYADLTDASAVAEAVLAAAPDAVLQLDEISFVAHDR